ncbi:MAG: intradiol ring-cleavage dioxygenase [Actinobacteria bacterium]|nr:intradiol ring-cleavage dioxygenase [Actinomycetota bacterium]MBV9936718.1 intradiol ring-cleavage dioxygenase [Actinomycetota bacterium]
MNGDPMTRRDALAALGLAGIGLVAVACGKSKAKSASATTTTGGATPSCTLMPELTEGPYYLDLKKVRSDITEGRPGAPVALKLVVVDATTCKPIKDAAVDIWHADAGGEYSGFGGAGGGPAGGGGTTNTQTFLRGTQVTDSDGAVTFNTIYPGWYTGRAVHIHVKVHVTSSVQHTGQLFFADATTDSVYAKSPYSSRGKPDVRNAQDSIYRQGGPSTIAPVQAAGDGYTATVTLGVKPT